MPDGGLGMLHVDSGYRRHNFARTCTIAICKKLERMFRTEDVTKKGLHPNLRWEHVDIVLGNEGSNKLIKEMEDWGLKTSWVCR